MKKSLILLVGVLFLGSFFITQKAEAEGIIFVNQEKIIDFRSVININQDNTLEVQETILYTFGKNQRHGIFRTIPLKGIKVKTEKVVDQFGHPYRFTVSKKGGNLKIKIGNPKVLVSGEHTYVISYKVWRGLRYFQDHDELYWNITGNEWHVPILQSEAIVHLPQEVAKGSLQEDCYTGLYGAKGEDCHSQINNGREIVFQSQRKFLPEEGMTIALGFPKNIVKEPSGWQKFLWKYGKFWSALIPLLVFLFLFQEWWRKGKDPKIKKPIIVRYQPPEGLKPAQVGLIMRQEVNSVDISATLIDLAVRGYIKIKEIEKPHSLGNFLGGKDYEIIKVDPRGKNVRNPKDDLLGYESKLLEVIFNANLEKGAEWTIALGLLKRKINLPGEIDLGSKKRVLLSTLKGRLSSQFKDIQNKIYKSIASAHYFLHTDPEKVKSKWATIGIIMMIFSGFIINTHNQTSLCLFWALLVSGLLFIIFSRFMPKKTKKGAEIYQQILGFKEYMNTAEKYRAQFYEKENIFEKYLPYAIVFGLTKKWAKAFEGIYKESPSWYGGSFGTQFTTLAFVDSMNQSLNSFNGVFAPSSGGGVSGLGGGGFSGGGSGGGGGGSW